MRERRLGPTRQTEGPASAEVWRGTGRSSWCRDSVTHLGAVMWDSAEHGPEDRLKLSFWPCEALKFHLARLPFLSFQETPGWIP